MSWGDVQRQRPLGIIGRILSYFSDSKSVARFKYERYLRGEKGRGLRPNFVKVGPVQPEHTNPHQCWAYSLESLIQTLTTLNEDPDDGKNRTVDIGK